MSSIDTTLDKITKEVIRKGIASSLYQELINPEQAYYMVLGRSYPWTEGSGVVLSGDGETIPYPTDDTVTYNENLRNGFFAKQINSFASEETMWFNFKNQMEISFHFSIFYFNN